MVYEDVDRPECLANCLESVLDLLDLCEISLDGQPLPSVRKILSKFINVARRPSEESNLTALGCECSCE